MPSIEPVLRRRLAHAIVSAMVASCLLVAGCGSIPTLGGSAKSGVSQPSGEGAPTRAVAAGTDVAAPAMVAIEEVEIGAQSGKLFADALDAIKAGRYGQAEALLQELTTREPGLSTPWFNLAKVYLAQSRTDEAIGALNKAVEANPMNCPAYNELGVLARQEGDFAKAEEAYLACIERVPGFRDAYLNLGILYELYLGRLPDALAAYRRYQALSESDDRRVRGWVMDLERRIGRQS